MESLENTKETPVCDIFDGNGLVPTTNKYYDFDSTLVCSELNKNAICNVKN